MTNIGRSLGLALAVATAAPQVACRQSHEQPPPPQYYLSKNGRVYYRDAEHRAHWVTPPPGGIQVPESEAAEYRGFQGYDNQPTGRDLSGLAADAP